jgi:histidine ammonia-lyase
MAPIAARKAAQLAQNSAGVIAVELIAAGQGIDYHAPLNTSTKLQAVHANIRELTPRFTSDRYWADEMAAVQRSVLSGQIAPELLPVLSG